MLVCYFKKIYRMEVSYFQLDLSSKKLQLVVCVRIQLVLFAQYMACSDHMQTQLPSFSKNTHDVRVLTPAGGINVIPER